MFFIYSLRREWFWVGGLNVRTVYIWSMGFLLGLQLFDLFSRLADVHWSLVYVGTRLLYLGLLICEIYGDDDDDDNNNNNEDCVRFSMCMAGEVC